MSNKTNSEKKMVQTFALWKRTGKKGNTYFTGKWDNPDYKLTAFYNTNKKNLKEPDLKIYTKDDIGNLATEPIVSLWCNASKNGKKYLTGKVEGKKVIAFINDKADEKHPYIIGYFGDEQKITEKTEKGSKTTKKGSVMEEVTPEEALPF